MVESVLSYLSIYLKLHTYIAFRLSLLMNSPGVRDVPHPGAARISRYYLTTAKDKHFHRYNWLRLWKSRRDGRREGNMEVV